MFLTVLGSKGELVSPILISAVKAETVSLVLLSVVKDSPGALPN